MTAPTPLFVLGVPRSGTTLLRVMLEGHPQLFSPPEMIIAPFETMAQRKAKLEERFWEKGGLRRALMELLQVDVDTAKQQEEELTSKTVPEVYAWLQEKLGERILVDKCPHLCADPEALQRIDRWFPTARYVWIVRHPGSVIRSIENMPYAEVMLQGYASDARDIWVNGNRVVESYLSAMPADRWVRIRYEDLVSDPAPVAAAICKVIGLEPHPDMLDPYKGERMREGPKGARAVGDPNMASRGKIEPELATKWLEGFDPNSVNRDTWDMAARFGYDLAQLERPPIARVSAELQSLLSGALALESNMRMPQDVDAVEGRRFLLRMLGASIDTFVEHDDVERPCFEHAEGPTRKMFADCPDTDYLRAPIQLGEGRTYRVWGRIPKDALYIGVVLYRRGGRVGKYLSDKELAVQPDGSFELRVGAEPGASTPTYTYLQGDGDETALIVRQYFSDRTREQPLTVNIEKLGELAPPPVLDASSMAKQLERSRRMLESVFSRTTQAYEMARVAALNRFIDIPGEALFPTPDNRYRVCWYRIGDDQVMLVRGKLPRARYFGLCLYNAWMESLDYRRRVINLNHAQIQTDAEGGFEVCLAHRNFDHPNWLDTAGHNAGYLLARALLPEGELPELSTEILYEKEWLARRKG